MKDERKFKEVIHTIKGAEKARKQKGEVRHEGSYY